MGLVGCDAMSEDAMSEQLSGLVGMCRESVGRVGCLQSAICECRERCEKCDSAYRVCMSSSRDNFFQDILNTPQRRMRAHCQVSRQEQENIDGSPRRCRVAPSQPLDPVRSAQGLLSLSPNQRKQHSVSELVSGAETTIIHSPTWSRFFLSLLIHPHLSTVPLLIARALPVSGDVLIQFHKNFWVRSRL